jgi:putative Mn2+ efflux pump MntP
MDLISSLLIAFGMAMDAFAVSLGVGAARQACSARSRFRLAFHFGLFQFFMPILGWLAGSTVIDWIAQFDHWLAMGLLGLVGGRMIKAGLEPDEHAAYPCDPSRGATLLLLAIATSIDALAVGLSLAMLQVSILYPSLIIGIITAGLSLVGLLAGHRLGAFGKRMEILGGLILNGIGLRVLITHLVA